MLGRRHPDSLADLAASLLRSFHHDYPGQCPCKGHPLQYGIEEAKQRQEASGKKLGREQETLRLDAFEARVSEHSEGFFSGVQIVMFESLNPNSGFMNKCHGDLRFGKSMIAMPP